MDKGFILLIETPYPDNLNVYLLYTLGERVFSVRKEAG